VGHWIPVETELPSIDEDVWVAHAGGVDLGYRAKMDCREPQWSWRQIEERGNTNDEMSWPLHGVTHWQRMRKPMPPPIISYKCYRCGKPFSGGGYLCVIGKFPYHFGSADCLVKEWMEAQHNQDVPRLSELA